MNDFYLPLTISLTENNVRHHYNETWALSAHDNVIRPLLVNSFDTFIYGLTDKNDLLLSNADILIKDKGRHKLDKSIRGHFEKSSSAGKFIQKQRIDM
ncbi:hypothetical protein [Chryseolinea sp. H1M3-3]|uniref:hypothetical protein n=1 Tax=Chryseolinea sp. H1M3-3 TaxID=3034144 RepID=UPI0023EB6C8D|nr:hypothetical protein [Chryseolinea sp. H1M3-3]